MSVSEWSVEKVRKQGGAEVICEVNASVFTSQIFFNGLDKQRDDFHLDENGHCFNFNGNFLQDGGQKTVVYTARLFFRHLF